MILRIQTPSITFALVWIRSHKGINKECEEININ